MAKLKCHLHWDNTNNEVIPTYTLLAVEPDDLINYVTTDDSFVIDCPDERKARKLGLTSPNKTPTDGRMDLYQIPKVEAPRTELGTNGSVDLLGAKKELKCGKLNGNKYEPWIGTGVTYPDDN